MFSCAFPLLLVLSALSCTGSYAMDKNKEFDDNNIQGSPSNQTNRPQEKPAVLPGTNLFNIILGDNEERKRIEKRFKDLFLGGGNETLSQGSKNFKQSDVARQLNNFIVENVMSKVLENKAQQDRESSQRDQGVPPSSSQENKKDEK